MKTNLNKIKFFDPKGMSKIAHIYRGMFVKRVTEEGKGYNGRQFPKYSKGYEKRIKSDFRKKDGNRYKGFEGEALTTGGNKLSKHSFILRGLTMGPALFKVDKVKRTGFELAWTGEAAEIVEGNDDKRKIVGATEEEKTFIARKLADLGGAEFKKIPNKIVIKMRK